MDFYKLNKYQSSIPEDLPSKVKDELTEYIETIPFIKHLISSEKVRGFAKDMKKYSSLDDDDENKFYYDDRIIVDVTKPHILEDLDFFRERAIFFNNHNKYTNIPPNPNPKSEYALFWKEEVRRWKEGLVRPSDGEWIPGYLYFYWNYSPIWLVKEDEKSKNKKRQKSERVRQFPHPWLGDYLFFHYIDQARQSGQHGKLLKMRGCGWSFKAGAISPCNMYIYKGAGMVNFHLASEKTFLSGDKGVFGKVVENLDWIANHTPLPKIRHKNSIASMEIKLGYMDKHGIMKGQETSVTGISLKDNPEKARGIRGPFIQYEEDGLFPNLEMAWGVNREAVESGSSSFGFMMAGGCLTENNLVWNNKGELKKISELHKNEGIIGFNQNTQTYSKEDITYWQPPTNKECVRIETNTGRFIECSLDHPILWSHQTLKTMKELPSINNKRNRRSLKKVEFKEACNIKIGEQLAILNELPLFSDKEIWEPRLLGWLIGDGSYGFNKTPILSNCEPEINSYLHCTLPYGIVTEKKYITKDGKNYEENRIKGICKYLREVGIYGQTKDKKTLPKNIHNYSYNTITELLGGLFDTDGTISNNGRISLSSAYKNLMLEVQLLLQKLGIHGNIIFKKPNLKNLKDKNGYYILEISDKSSVLNFQKHIKLYPKVKHERLKNIHKIYENRKSENASHLQGLKFERVVKIENLGIRPVYNLTAGTTNTYVGNGIITHNTGGTEGASFEGSRKLFYKPDGYNIYGVQNVYDKNIQNSVKCGFFWGAYMNRHRCYDENVGEPDVIKALIEIIENRHVIAKNSFDISALTQARAEKPITPQEAIMRVEGTIFPVADLSDYLNSIKPEEQRFISQHYVGELVYDPVEKVVWKPNADLKPIRTNEVGKINRIGAVEIFELPKKDSSGKITSGRYIAGIDPIDADDGQSLFSILVMDLLTDRIVAEYTGRYPKAEQCYEMALKLCIFYNAQANYENNLKGLHTYFKHKNALSYLADTPEILKDMDMLKPSMSNPKGTRSTKPINAWGRQLQVTWMLSEAYTNESETNKLNLHTIRSLGYLEECIVWNHDGNFDRVSAANMLFILREDKLRHRHQLKNQEIKTKNTWTNSNFFNKVYGVQSMSNNEKYQSIFKDS